MKRLAENTEMRRIASAARNGASRRESREAPRIRVGHGKPVVLLAALFGYLTYPLLHERR
jgi:hypothetical protein